MQTDLGKFIAVVIGIVTATLTLSRLAYGRPVKGDHRSVTSFIMATLTIVFVLAFDFAAISKGIFSLYAAILFAFMLVIQIVSYLFETDLPTRWATFHIASVMAIGTIYSSLGFTYVINEKNREVVSALFDTYKQTTEGTVLIIEKLIDKLQSEADQIERM